MTDDNFSAPRRPFCERRINALKVARHPFQPEPASRNDLSLPRNDCLLPGFHYGIEVSGLLLRCPVEHSSGPFGLRLLRSLRFAPVRAKSTPPTRFPTPVPQPRPATRSPLPFRAFCAPPDRTFQPGNCSRGSPPGCVRWSFAPRRLLYWNSFGCGSTFRARLASGWLAEIGRAHV